jgi:hypothetical protein
MKKDESRKKREFKEVEGQKNVKLCSIFPALSA